MTADARAALVRAVDACVLTRHGLAHLLGEDRPPWKADVAEGLRHYGPGDWFSIWQWWRGSGMLTRLHHDTLTTIWARGIDRIVRRLNGDARVLASGARQFACAAPTRTDPWTAHRTHSRLSVVGVRI